MFFSVGVSSPRKLLLFLGYLVVLSVSIISYRPLMQRKRLASALGMGHLASLPASVRTVQVDTKGNLFARSFWVTFTAPVADIQQWVKQSPALANNQPTPCAHPVLFGEQPSWFNLADIRSGLRYQISQDAEAIYGTVWIDPDRQIVYIKISYS
jgi:hypothetical protein